MSASPPGRRRRVGVTTASAAALLCAFAAAGCGPDGRAARAGPPRAGDPLPAFAAATLAGDTVRLREVDAPLLVNLWATWCVPCRTETPYLQSVHEAQAGNGLRVIGISVDNRAARDAVERFVDTFGVTYTILHDPSMTSMDAFGAIGLPATYLVDGNGTLTYARLGPLAEGDPAFEEAVRKLVEPKP